MKPLYFDREPIDTAVTFGYNNANNTKEDPAMKTTSAAKELSLDNGRTFMTRDDIKAEGLDAILAAHPAITWDAITNAMDDETRETVAAELAPCSEEEFLLRYLELAPANLIIG